MKTLRFTPFSFAETDVLIKMLSGQEKFCNKYKITKSINLNTKSILYGISIKRGDSWYPMSFEDRAIVFLDKNLVNKVGRVIKKLIDGI